MAMTAVHQALTTSELLAFGPPLPLTAMGPSLNENSSHFPSLPPHAKIEANSHKQVRPRRQSRRKRGRQRRRRRKRRHVDNSDTSDTTYGDIEWDDTAFAQHQPIRPRMGTKLQYNLPETYRIYQNQHKNKKPVHVNINQQTVNGLLSLLLLFSLSTCGCLGNVFLMSSLTVIESLQTRGNCYLVSVALAHLLVTLFVIPSSAVQIMAGEAINGERLCHYQWLAMEFSLIVTQLSFLLIALDNFLGYKSSEKVTTTLEPSPNATTSHHTLQSPPKLLPGRRTSALARTQVTSASQLPRRAAKMTTSAPAYWAGAQQTLPQAVNNQAASCQPGRSATALPPSESCHRSLMSEQQAVADDCTKKQNYLGPRRRLSSLIGRLTAMSSRLRVERDKGARLSLAQQFADLGEGAHLQRARCLSYRNCCGRLRVLVWILFAWSLAFAYTVHQHTHSYGPNFCRVPAPHNLVQLAFNSASGKTMPAKPLEFAITKDINHTTSAPMGLPSSTPPGQVGNPLGKSAPSRRNNSPRGPQDQLTGHEVERRLAATKIIRTSHPSMGFQLQDPAKSPVNLAATQQQIVGSSESPLLLSSSSLSATAPPLPLERTTTKTDRFSSIRRLYRRSSASWRSHDETSRRAISGAATRTGIESDSAYYYLLRPPSEPPISRSGGQKLTAARLSVEKRPSGLPAHGAVQRLSGATTTALDDPVVSMVLQLEALVNVGGGPIVLRAATNENGARLGAVQVAGAAVNWQPAFPAKTNTTGCSKCDSCHRNNNDKTELPALSSGLAKEVHVDWLNRLADHSYENNSKGENQLHYLELARCTPVANGLGGCDLHCHWPATGSTDENLPTTTISDGPPNLASGSPAGSDGGGQVREDLMNNNRRNDADGMQMGRPKTIEWRPHVNNKREASRANLSSLPSSQTLINRIGPNVSTGADQGAGYNGTPAAKSNDTVVLLRAGLLINSSEWLFWIWLSGSIVFPTLASSILFARAYVKMKEFKKRPYKPMPSIGAVSWSTLNSATHPILMPHSPIPMIAQRQVFKFPAPSSSKLATGECLPGAKSEMDNAPDTQRHRRYRQPPAPPSEQHQQLGQAMSTPAPGVYGDRGARHQQRRRLQPGIAEAQAGSSNLAHELANNDAKSCGAVARAQDPIRCITSTPTMALDPSPMQALALSPASQQSASFSAPPSATFESTALSLEKPLGANASQHRAGNHTAGSSDQMRLHQQRQQQQQFEFRRDQIHAHSFHCGSHSIQRSAHLAPAATAEQHDNINPPSSWSYLDGAPPEITRGAPAVELFDFQQGYESIMSVSKRSPPRHHLSPLGRAALTEGGEDRQRRLLERHKSLPRSSRLYKPPAHGRSESTGSHSCVRAASNIGPISNHNYHQSAAAQLALANVIMSIDECPSATSGESIKFHERHSLKQSGEQLGMRAEGDQHDVSSANTSQWTSSLSTERKRRRCEDMRSCGAETATISSPATAIGFCPIASRESESPKVFPAAELRQNTPAPRRNFGGDSKSSGSKVILCTYFYMTDDQLLKSNIIAFLVNLTFWLPFVLLSIVCHHREHSNPATPYLQQELKDAAWWLATLNCCSCSYVYALSNKDFRNAYNKLFYYCCCKSHVTFPRKMPIFRRQLDVDSSGNLRVHIIPGLNLYSQKSVSALSQAASGGCGANRTDSEQLLAPAIHSQHLASANMGDGNA